ncbi:MAG: dihydrodipicolinate synthase family protein [Verrucomicrobiales bacterium]|nr:dihydrodipicolinate synthase family protein [Verrucomicrobiales bacterium]
MLKGIFPVIPTLFNDDNSLDLEGQRQVVRFALDAGAHGVVFPGVASEYNFLTPDERGELIGLVAKEVDGRVPIVGGASAPTPEEVIVAGQQAASNGINHLMIMAPGALEKNLEAHQAFFREVSSGLPNAEIILQNAPSPIGAGLEPDAIATLAAGNAAITYVKEETLPSGPAITTLAESGIPHLKAVFGGGGARYIIDELNRGALGQMPAVELTDLHVALWNAYFEGDLEKARDLYRISLPLLVSQAVYRMRLTKYVLMKRGVSGSLAVRAPLPGMDDFTKRDLDQMITDLEGALS